MYDGMILANVWVTNDIVAIDPHTGDVMDVWDFSALTAEMESNEGYQDYSKITADYCLNGIAYNKKRKTFFVTGKKWNKIFEIRIFKV